MRLVACAVVGLLALVPVASAGPVGTADSVCDAAVAPLGASCLLDCSNLNAPALQAVCVFVDSVPAPGSVWAVCGWALGPVRACDPATYHCDSNTLYTVHTACVDVINPTLDGL